MSEIHSIHCVTPEPRIEINIRAAVPGNDDFAFIDELQKPHTKALGFMHRGTLEGYIASGDVLIAETPPPTAPDGSPLPGARGVPLGYCMGRDRYFKREDVGILYQLVIIPEKRRDFIGAALVKAMFEKAAYGCKLFCAWCAQDLEANHFWESIGFVPLAFRTGSAAPGKERIHIFWQKRIREGDTGPGATPWWFPSQTNGGAIREDRLVLPIPPDTHWSDAKPTVLPEIPGVDRFVDEPPQLTNGEGGRRKARRKYKPKMTAPEKRKSQSGGLWFGAPPDELAAKEKSGDRTRKARIKRKYHPKYTAAARELCARYLEEVQAGRFLPEAAGDGKYDVRKPRMLGTDDGICFRPEEVRLLNAA